VGKKATRPAHPVPRASGYTLRRQWPAEVLLGAFSGVLGLGQFALVRSLGAPEEYVPLVIVLGQVPWIFAPAWQPLFTGMDRSKAFIVLGLLSKGPLLLTAFVAAAATGQAGHGQGNYVLFLVCLVLYFVADAAYIPHRSALIASNYPAAIRGRMFGLLATGAMVATIVASKAAGRVLDRDPAALRWLFPLAALVGIAGHVLLSRIRWRAPRAAVAAGGRGLKAAGRAVARTWRDTVQLLKKDPSFRRYETGFMLYGFGLNMTAPVLILYAESALGASYDDWTTAQGLVNPLAYLLSIALLGRLVDRMGVVRLTTLAFGLLGIYFALLPLVHGIGALVATYALFGVAMAAVNLGWNLGPLHFAPTGKSHLYMSVHVGLVALRSTFGPLAGFAVYRWVSADATFLTSAALQALAVVLMLQLDRRVRAAERRAVAEIPPEPVVPVG
jgi:MFS family permease